MGEVIKIQLICPVCGKRCRANIKKNKRTLNGVIRRTYTHKTPHPHTLIVDFDCSGTIRAAYIRTAHNTDK